MKTKIISLLLCVGMICACNNTQKGAGIGAGGGALLGGIIGAIAGNTMVGAAIGGAVGAGAGAIIGKKMDKAKAEAEQVKNAQVEGEGQQRPGGCQGDLRLGYPVCYG